MCLLAYEFIEPLTTLDDDVKVVSSLLVGLVVGDLKFKPS